MSQFEELETFARFGTRLDEETRERLKRGRAVRAILRQQERQPLPIVEQIIQLYCALQGLFDSMPTDRLEDAVAIIRTDAMRAFGDVGDRIIAGRALNEADRESILTLCRQALENRQLPGRTNADA
jgi:F-type H+-transporting ATPase subunit alpha